MGRVGIGGVVPGCGERVGRAERCGREAARRAVGGRLRQGFAAVAGVRHRAQAVHRAVHRELCRAEPLHHVAAPCLAALLEGGQDAVRRREAALYAFRGDGAPGDHAVPVEEGAGEGVCAHGGVRFARGEEGPAAGDGRWAAAGGGAGGRGQRAVTSARDAAFGAVGRGARGATRAQQGAHGGQRVVREVSGPGQVPDGVGQLGIGDVGVGRRADLVGDLAEEQAVAPGEGGQDGLVERRQLQGVRRGQEQRSRVRHVQGYPAVLAGEGSCTGPDDLSGCGELVEHRGRVARDAGRQDQLLQGRRGHGRALQLLDGTHQSVDTAQPVSLADVLPLREELGERGRGHRLQLVPQGGQGAAAQAAQHGRVAPLLADARRMELPLYDTAVRGEALQCSLRDGHAEAEAGRRCGRREGAVGASIAGEEVAEGVLHRFREGLRDADRQGCAEGVAQAARVLDRCPVVGAGDADLDRAAGAGQFQAHCGSAPRSARSASVSGPSMRRRSATPSASLTRRSSVSHWSSRSSSVSTSASSNSRSSAWPSSSASSRESRESAAARRSASGESPRRGTGRRIRRGGSGRRGRAREW